MANKKATKNSKTASPAFNSPISENSAKHYNPRKKVRKPLRELYDVVECENTVTKEAYYYLTFKDGK